MINRRTLITASLVSTLVAGAAAAQTLRIGLTTDVDILDPMLTRSFSSSVVGAALCDRLVDNGTELEIVPQLATEWSGPATERGSSSSFDQASSFTTANPSTPLPSNTISSAC